jgi:hypothetical protein
MTQPLNDPLPKNFGNYLFAGCCVILALLLIFSYYG